MDLKDWVPVAQVATPPILLFSAGVAYSIFLQNASQKAMDRTISERQKRTDWELSEKQKKIDRAITLFQSLMTGEFLVKARLISQEYLLEHPESKKFETFGARRENGHYFNYEELDIELQKPHNKEFSGDRFYLRAIPNFFQTVNLAKKHGYIDDNEWIFSEMYAWYWVNIIYDRRVEGDPMYNEHKWMRRDADIDREWNRRLARRRKLGLPDDNTPNHPLQQTAAGVLVSQGS